MHGSFPGYLLWVIEYAPQEDPTADALAWMKAIVPWLDQQPFIDRHAWFMNAPVTAAWPTNLMNANRSGLSDFGTWSPDSSLRALPVFNGQPLPLATSLTQSLTGRVFQMKLDSTRGWCWYITNMGVGAGYT